MKKTLFPPVTSSHTEEKHGLKAQQVPVIALVDDDRNILTSVQMTLEAEGFTVHA